MFNQRLNVAIQHGACVMAISNDAGLLTSLWSHSFSQKWLKGFERLELTCVTQLEVLATGSISDQRELTDRPYIRAEWLAGGCCG